MSKTEWEMARPNEAKLQEISKTVATGNSSHNLFSRG